MAEASSVAENRLCPLTRYFFSAQEYKSCSAPCLSEHVCASPSRLVHSLGVPRAESKAALSSSTLDSQMIRNGPTGLLTPAGVIVFNIRRAVTSRTKRLLSGPVGVRITADRKSVV